MRNNSAAWAWRALDLEGPGPTNAQTVAAVLVSHKKTNPKACERSNQLLNNMGIKGQDAGRLTTEALNRLVLGKLGTNVRVEVQKAKRAILLNRLCQGIELSDRVKDFCRLKDPEPTRKDPEPTSAQTVAAVLLSHTPTSASSCERSNQLLKNMRIKDQNAKSLTRDQLRETILEKMGPNTKSEINDAIKTIQESMQTQTPRPRR